MLGEVEGVLAHASLNRIGVPSLECLENVRVVDHGVSHPLVIPDRGLADRPHVDLQPGDQFAKEAGVGQFDDALVKVQV